MKHLNQEDLVLEYYGERRHDGIREHLEACESCRASFESLARVLNAMNDFEAPERSAVYGSRVWHQIAPQLRQSRQPWWSGFSWWLTSRRLAAISAMRSE